MKKGAKERKEQIEIQTSMAKYDTKYGIFMCKFSGCEHRKHFVYWFSITLFVFRLVCYRTQFTSTLIEKKSVPASYSQHLHLSYSRLHWQKTALNQVFSRTCVYICLFDFSLSQTFIWLLSDSVALAEGKQLNHSSMSITSLDAIQQWIQIPIQSSRSCQCRFIYWFVVTMGYNLRRWNNQTKFHTHTHKKIIPYRLLLRERQ